MRVIAGRNRGTKLTAPAGKKTRPTSDRVKEALFSILTGLKSFEGTRVLDVCAGTGSLGIEALSRGADSCSFVEHDPLLKCVLEKNVAVTHVGERAEILLMDAHRALRLLAGRQRTFGLVFFDPPYDSGLYATIPAALCSSGLLARGSIVVVECSARTSPVKHEGSLVRFDRREYGDTALELYSLEEL